VVLFVQMTTNLSDVQKSFANNQKWNCCLLLFFQRLIVFCFEGLRQKKSGKWCQMEFSHWRQKEIHAGQKILLGCKIGQVWIIRYGAYRKFWSTPKKEFVAFMTEQTKKTSNDLSKTLLLSTN
jgi:hypothetical protein